MDDSTTGRTAPLGRAFDFAATLAFHRASLLRLVEREARGVLAHESADDLVQGIHVRALGAASNYVHDGERGFLAWLATIARRHVADRHEHWTALRRAAPDALRITLSGGSAPGGVQPAASAPGPGTQAGNREALELAVKALDRLDERDRALVRYAAADLSLDEIAKRLCIGYEAAKKARQRALDRLRDAAREVGLDDPERRAASGESAVPGSP